jgi:inner membrane protein
MTWRTHLTAGVLFTVPLVLLMGNEIAPALLGAMFGSLLPDLDAYESRLGNYEIGKVKPFKPVSRTLFYLLGHRGVLHSLFGTALLGGVCLLSLILLFSRTEAEALLPLVSSVIGLLLGYLSHLFMDGCTLMGIPLWWPDKKRFHFLPKGYRFTTGSPAEFTLLWVLGTITVLLLLPLLTSL